MPNIPNSTRERVALRAHEQGWHRVRAYSVDVYSHADPALHGRPPVVISWHNEYNARTVWIDGEEEKAQRFTGRSGFEHGIAWALDLDLQLAREGKPEPVHYENGRHPFYGRDSMR